MNLTDCVLVLISLVGLAKLIQSVLPLKFCISFVYAQLIIAFLLFTAGLIGELKPIAISLRVIGWLSFCIWIVPKINIKNTGQVLSYANLYLLVTISLFLLFTYSTYYQTYAGVDDYAHWAPISRSLALNDHLVTKELAIHGHADYPPGLALIHYFYTQFCGFSNQLILFAQGVLVLSSFSVLFVYLDEIKKRFSLSVFLLLFLAIGSVAWIFLEGLHSLWADLPLGVFFGFSLFIYISKDNTKTVESILKASPLLLFLPLIKQIGILFTFFAVGIIFIDVVFNIKNQIRYQLIVAAAVALGALLLNYVWRSYVDFQGIQGQFHVELTLKDVVNSLFSSGRPIAHSFILSAFVQWMFYKTHLATYWFFCATLFMLISVVTDELSKRFRLGILFVNLLIGFFCYSFVLLLLYMFSFSEEEGLVLASIGRYISTYILGMVVISGGVLFENISSASLSLKKLLAGVLSVFLVIIPNLGRLMVDIKGVVLGLEYPGIGSYIQRQGEYVVRQTPASSRIYYLWIGENSGADELQIFNYAIYPRKSNTSCAQIILANNTDVALANSSCHLSSRNLKDLSKTYDYLFIGFSSSNSVTSFPLDVNKTREVKAGDLYQIQKMENSVELKLISEFSY